MSPRHLFAASLAGCLAFAMPAQADDALTPVPDLDLDRYAGVWHEIARLPNRFEDQCVADITATYTPLEDGRIRVVNACREDDGQVNAVEGEARQAGALPSQLEVRFAPKWLSFLPFVWADYWVLALGDDYQWALVGEPDRKYLWILSRSERMDRPTFDAITARARGLGFELDELVVVNPPAD